MGTLFTHSSENWPILNMTYHPHYSLRVPQRAYSTIFPSNTFTPDNHPYPE
jgi:hypothetical protein